MFQKKCRIGSCIVLVVFVLGSLAAAEAGPTIVADGKSAHEILVARSAFPITVRAAEDLQHYVAKSTGVRLPIRRGDRAADRPAIVVGGHPLAREAGVFSEDLRPGGFHIRTDGGNLYIVGRDTKGSARSDHWRSGPQSGTWYGVSEFLESQLGIRWFFPGDMGEVVPRRKTLVIPDLDVRDWPRMDYRRMTYLWDKNTPRPRRDEVMAWKRRNRGGMSIVWQASHSWLIHFKGETYFKDHPKWFALVNGRRLGYAPHGLQMCTTSSEALDEFARVIIEHGEKNPGVMFSLSPNDGGSHCECENCRRLDVETFPDGHPVLTDRYVTYCNEVAKRVCKVHPDQTFGFYAYSYYADPPRRTRLHPNVRVMEVQNSISLLYFSPKVRRSHLNNRLIPWRKMVGKLYFYSHPDGMGALNLPTVTPSVVRDIFSNLRAAGVTGFAMCNSSSFASTGLNNYLYLKMAWNPARDFEALYGEALDLCYGKSAAPHVRAYNALVEARLAKMTQAAQQKFDRSMGSARRIPDSLEIVYPGLHEAGMPVLRKALAAAETPGQKARVQMLTENLDYTRMTVDLYAKGRKVANDRDTKAGDIAACLKLAKARHKWMRDRDQTNFGRFDSDVGSERRFAGLPLDPQVYEYLLSSAKGVKKEAIARRVTAAPVLDGRLDDAVWQGLPELTINLSKETASPLAVKAVARISRDQEHLYIGVYCEEPLMAHVKDSIRQRDGKVWAENELEFFFDVEDSAKDFHQLCVNTLGTVFDKTMRDGKMVEWDSRVKAAAARDEKAWSVEMAIPFEAFGTQAALPGDVWGFNVCRVRTVTKPSEYTCWSPTFGGFHAPRRFGKLILH